MLILGIIFAGVSLIASRLLAPRQPTAAKEEPYECGITSSQEPPERFPVRFFLVGMIFIVFDVEIFLVVIGRFNLPGPGSGHFHFGPETGSFRTSARLDSTGQP